jgi:hypothetical protein
VGSNGILECKFLPENAHRTTPLVLLRLLWWLPTIHFFPYLFRIFSTHPYIHRTAVSSIVGAVATDLRTHQRFGHTDHTAPIAVHGLLPTMVPTRIGVAAVVLCVEPLGEPLF